MDDVRVEVRRCPPQVRPKAIRLLFDRSPEDQQSALVQALDTVSGEAQDALDGLLVASVAGVDRAALWVQLGAGNTATVWPPPTQDIGARELLCAATELLDGREISLAQIFAAADSSIEPGVLAECGFPRIVELVYVYAEAIERPASEADESESLQFIPGAGEDRRRLEDVTQRTYVDSLDCPALDGVRPLSDVIDTYYAQGVYNPERWYFVQYEGVDAGVLLLSEHPASGNWELVYMGVAPQARGRKLGRCIAAKARELAGRGGAQRVVAAVDVQNEPALAAYRDVGFRQWDRRAVYGRLAKILKRGKL